MKFTHCAAVLAIFLGSTEAIRLRCPDDTNRLKAVLGALAGEGESKSSCSTCSGGCPGCGAAAAPAFDSTSIAKATKHAVDKAMSKYEKRQQEKEKSDEAKKAIEKVADEAKKVE